jgi:hypothetical protein
MRALGQPFVLSDDLIWTNDACRSGSRYLGGAKPFYQIGRSGSHWLIESWVCGECKKYASFARWIVRNYPELQCFIQLIVVHKVGCLMVYSWGSQVLKKDNLTASLRLSSAAPAIHKLAIGYGVDQGLEMCHKKPRQHHSTLKLRLRVWSGICEVCRRFQPWLGNIREN